jgi:HAD superfamily hydrolase (TIGR01509 family)
VSRSARRFGAVIFDLDGVLVDAEIWWDEVRIAFAHRHGRTWTEADRAAIMGANSFGWSTLMQERLDLRDVPREVIEVEVVEAMVARYRSEGAPLIPGAVETVRRVAAESPVAVASSGHPAVIAAALEALGVAGLFGAVVSSDEVPVGKPDPGVYLLAAERLGVAPADCLVIEDSLNGVLAGRAAGMIVALVPNAAVPPAAGAREAASVVLDQITLLDPDEIASRVPGSMPDPVPSTSPGPSPGQVPDPGSGGVHAPAPGPEPVPRPPRGPGVGPRRQALRYGISMLFASMVVRALFRVRVEGRERLPTGPALLCFNHQSWADPFVLMATLPWRPRLSFFGPKEDDMSRGARNRIMKWTGTAIPFKPTKNDLIEATRRVAAVFDGGGVVAIAGEGRIHDGERELLPLNEGAAFFALRSGVPLVPVAINGTSWLVFGRRIRVRVGEPIAPAGRASREAVDELSRRAWAGLHDLVADYPDPVPPRPGSAWYRLTEMFNEWPEGGRPSPSAAIASSAAGAPPPGGAIVPPEQPKDSIDP